MQPRSSHRHRSSEPNDRLVAHIQPRSWGDSPTHEAQATQPQIPFHDFSHVDLFAYDPGPRAYPRLVIQPKLTVGQPNDRYEQEADRVAEQVMKMPDSATPSAVQRQEGEDEELQAKAIDAPTAAPDQIVDRLESSKSGGSPLPADVRTFMEPRFGADFSQVRVHTGSEAVQMNRDLNAQAFTHRQDVFFGDGKAPAKDALTAHELTHVVQQTGAIAQPKAAPKQISPKKVAPSLLPGLSGRDPAIQRAPGLPSSAYLRTELNLKPGMKLTKSGWEKLEKALDEYQRIGDRDYSAQLTKLSEIKGFVETWWHEHTNPANRQFAKKPKEQKKVDYIKILRGKIKSRKETIRYLQKPPSQPPTVIPTQAPVALDQPPSPQFPPVIPTQAPLALDPPQRQLRVGMPGQGSPLPNQFQQQSQPSQPQSNDTQTATNTQVVTPPQPQSAPVQAPDPWETAALKADPALMPQHQGADWYLKPGGECASFNNGEIDVPFSFPGGSTKVQNVAAHTRTKQLLKAGAKLSSPSGKLYKPFAEAEVVSQVVQSVGDQRVVLLSGISGEFSVAASDLSDVQEDGYKFTYDGEVYWALQTELHQLSAGYEDATTAPLYPTDPKADHVLQGALGDCYLLAAAASIARTNPAYIKEMIRDNGDGTVSVRLHNVTESSSRQMLDGEYLPQRFAATPIYIKVNKSVAKKTGRELYAQKNLWVIMLEKAYAASGLTGYLLQSAPSGSYDNIDGGRISHAFEVLLGQEATKPAFALKRQVQGDDAVFNQIQQALTAGKAVAAGTRALGSGEAQSGTGHSGGEAISGGMVAKHSYSVLSVRQDGQQKWITVRNPWGKRDNTSNDPDDNGVFELTLTQFLDWFTSLSISGEIRTLSQ